MKGELAWQDSSANDPNKFAEKRRKTRSDVEENGNGPLPGAQHGKNIPKLGREAQEDEPAAQPHKDDADEDESEDGEIKTFESLSVSEDEDGEHVDKESLEDAQDEPGNHEDDGHLRRSLRRRSESDSTNPPDQSPGSTSGERAEKRTRTLPSTTHHCERCGKVYKHKNCLVKHAWEHHESWPMTKKWCATKHQQVQMLEAAQVLVEMTTLQGKVLRRNEQQQFVMMGNTNQLFRGKRLDETSTIL